MEVVVSQVRWPVEPYRKLKEIAHDERKSINALVVEIVKDFVERHAQLRDGEEIKKQGNNLNRRREQ